MDGYLSKKNNQEFAKKMIPLIKGFLVGMEMVELKDFQGYGDVLLPSEREQELALERMENSSLSGISGWYADPPDEEEK
jgi:hypothetical protein